MNAARRKLWEAVFSYTLIGLISICLWIGIITGLAHVAKWLWP